MQEPSATRVPASGSEFMETLKGRSLLDVAKEFVSDRFSDRVLESELVWSRTDNRYLLKVTYRLD